MSASYNDSLVFLSVVVATLAAYAALSLGSRAASAREHPRAWIVAAALMMGTAIWAMHFIGMLALQLPIPLSYDYTLTIYSAMAAVAASLVVPVVVLRQPVRDRWLLVGGTVMGIGICTMHYTGMAALHLQPSIQYDPTLFILSALIAISASIVALMIVGHFGRRGTRARQWQLLLGALVMGGAISGMHYTGMAAAEFAPGSVCLADGAIGGGSLAVIVAVLTLVVVLAVLLVALVDARAELQARRLSHLLDDANAELLRRTLYDALTGLPNRRQFETHLREAICRSRVRGNRLALLQLGLDGFRQVNMTRGYHIGDEILRTLASRIDRLVEEERGFCGRIGGDEWVVLLETCNAARAERIAAELQRSIRQPLRLERDELVLSVSVGIALAPEHDNDGDRLMLKADWAMREAKREGRNGCCLYTPLLAARHADSLDVERDLRLAIERGELALHYQPKVSAFDGELRSVEALLRWKHPQRGEVPAEFFVPLAERNGLIVDIGRWVLHEACRQARVWQDTGLDIPVSINLSPSQCRAPGLVESVKMALAVHHLPPRLLRIEITEAGAMQDRAREVSVIEALRRVGVEFSIDDFGTGYSCLARLREIPVRELKLDRQFVRTIDTQAGDRSVVRAVVQLSHALSLRLVAEGVETEHQAQILRELGCDELQGFLFGEAMPADALLELARRSRTVPERTADGTAAQAVS